MNFLKNFIFTEFSDSSDKGVDSFLITTLEAAVLYIQSIDLKEFKRLNTPAIIEEKQRHFINKSTFIDYLFGKIIAEDEVEIIKLLKTDKDVIIGGKRDKSNQTNHLNDDVPFDQSVNNNNCMINDTDDGIDENIIEELDLLNKFPESRLNLQNRHGVGAIHVAAMHGLPKMLNLLLALGVNLHIKDENNWTALHYAGSRGHQNTLLLLLHAGADINAVTNDKNTVLHLSSLNGHSNCVKALLYYSDHMKVSIERNAQNKFGDTALHLASKWGFSEIIEALLEYGLKFDIRNRAGHTAHEYAHNSHIETSLQNACLLNEQTNETNISDWEKNHSECSSSSATSTTAATTAMTMALNQAPELFRGCYSTMISSEVTNKNDSVPFIHKTSNDKIVAAIKNDDTKLACHFLGIELPDEVTQNVCHPLCDCDKCKHITEYLSHKPIATAQLTRIYDGDINECSSTEGITLLHAAIEMKNRDLIENIVGMGANIAIRSKQTQQTAIHYAVLTKSLDILNVILTQIQTTDNAIDAQDVNGDTALHLAVSFGDVNLTDALLKHEPNINIVNSEGKTAYDIAKSLLQLNIMRILELADNSNVN